MKTLLESEDFCRDAFGGTIDESALVARMMRTRKRVRVANAAKMICCAAAVMLGAITLTTKRSAPVTNVVSAPVAADWKVRSVRFDGIVHTRPLAELMVVRSDPANVAIVRSRAGGLFKMISDEQMFAMLHGWSVAMVKVNGVTDLEIMAPQTQ